ncbi:MAG: electron transfer flavoprotein subunit beta [Euryarchaeota archaeon]|mgnify:CR=1 FL=1|nr:electron transfer flavoprotein subunit beta [Euryarchaeota archaeon]
MTVAVLLKQVPDTTAKVSVSDGKIDEGSISKWSISPYDEYALESAIQLKESGFGEVVAITCGPGRSSKALTEAAAVGADNLVHIHYERDFPDSTQIQALLAAAISRSGSDVVLCGKQAADTNSGSTGPGVASILGFSCVGFVSEVSFDGRSFSATRSGPSGLEKVEVSSPCLFTFDKGDSELRRPNVRGIMMAKKKPIEAISPEDLGVEIGDSSVQVESHSPPKEKPPGQKFEGADSVQMVVEKLREEANVI